MKRPPAVELLETEQATIKPRLKTLRAEIAEHERAIARFAWRVKDFPDDVLSIEQLINLCCEKYRFVLDLEVRARTIRGDISRLKYPVKEFDGRTRAHRGPRGPRKPYKMRGRKRVLTPAQS